MNLLQQLCSIHAPSGDENLMIEFILNYIKINKKNWKKKPKIFSGTDFRDGIVLVFGKPRTAIFAHIDSVGFTARYNKQLVRIGSPDAEDGDILTGYDSNGIIDVIYRKTNDEYPVYESEREADTGTNFTYKPNYSTTDSFVISPFLDNRIGVWVALMIAETLTNGIICFTTREEHKGGSVRVISKFIYEKYKVKQALISDITWISEGITFGNGVVISLRDAGLPCKAFVNKIIECAKQSDVLYQLEVEEAGGSDGHEIQTTPYPIQWAFVGAAQAFSHSSREQVHMNDIVSMLNFYKILMEKI